MELNMIELDEPYISEHDEYPEFSLSYKLCEEEYILDMQFGHYMIKYSFVYGEEPVIVENKLLKKLREWENDFIENYNFHPYEHHEYQEYSYQTIERFSQKDYINKLCKRTICKSARIN